VVLNIHAPTQDKIDDVKDNFYEELERVLDQFPKYHMKTVFGDLNAKVGKEDIFIPTIWNESLHEISNGNGVRVVNSSTTKNLTVTSTMFSHRYIHKYTCASPNGKPHNQIDQNLVDRRRHSNGLYVRSYGAANCDTEHFLVVAKAREQ
jgi:hypothetical protein